MLRPHELRATPQPQPRAYKGAPYNTIDAYTTMIGVGRYQLFAHMPIQYFVHNFMHAHPFIWDLRPWICDFQHPASWYQLTPTLQNFLRSWNEILSLSYIRGLNDNCMFDVLWAHTICTHFQKNSHNMIFALFFEFPFCFLFVQNYPICLVFSLTCIGFWKILDVKHTINFQWPSVEYPVNWTR